MQWHEHLADGHTATPAVWSRIEAAVVGPRIIRRLTIAHAVDNFADSLITLSLIGSLFFSVSLEASRSRHPAVPVADRSAPLAIVAQVVGPALDRIRAGPRSRARHLAARPGLVRHCCSPARCCRWRSIRWCSASCCRGRRTRWRKTATGGPTGAGTSRAAPRRSGHLARTGTIVGGIGAAVGGCHHRPGRCDVAARSPPPQCSSWPQFSLPEFATGGSRPASRAS